MLCACFWHSHKLLTGMVLLPRILIEYVRVLITWVGQCSSARVLPIENLTSGRRGLEGIEHGRTDCPIRENATEVVRVSLTEYRKRKLVDVRVYYS